MNITSITCVLLLCISVPAEALDHPVEQFLSNFVKQYERPYTIFEISGDGALTSPTLAMNNINNVTVVILLEQDSPKLTAAAQEAVYSMPDNVVLLKPHHLFPSNISTLGHCEHPDIVIVHDLSPLLKHSSPPYLDLMLNIGDYLGIDIPAQDLYFFKYYYHDRRLMTTIPHPNNDGGFFAFFKTGKKGLLMPRWSSASHKKKLPYAITSSFKKKTLYNKALKKTTTWLRGINLLTFVMLSGVYPSDKTILEKLKKLDGIKHNDLVIGNILIQGTNLQPIDCNDQRRSSSSHYCINALQHVFKNRKKYASPNVFLSAYKRFFKKD